MSQPNNSNVFEAETRDVPPRIDYHRADSQGAEPPYAEHGAPIDRSPAAEMKKKAGKNLLWPRTRNILRDSFSEFLGTFILVMFGDAAIAQYVLSNGEKGSWLSVAWGYGLGLMLGVYTGGISGSHLNPGVTFANCLFRKFPWRKFPEYMLAQVLGAMCAAAVVYGNYKSAIDTYEGGRSIRTVPGFSDTATAGIFATYPAEFMTRTGAFFSEVIGSALLMFLIYALKDDGNVGAGNLTPLGLFFVMTGISIAFGWETGFALNLARDFGPRLMTCFLGYGHEVWSASGYYFWIPMVAPFIGCSFGGFLYDLLIFNGESPINSPNMGINRFIPSRKAKHTDGQQYDSKV